MGVYEVTNGEYDQFIKDNEQERERRALHPVTHVNWIDVQKYIKWLNQKRDLNIPGNNWRYSLPTESQWELACRGGTDNDYFWGNSPEEGNGYLNGLNKKYYDDKSSYDTPFSFDDGYQETSPVGTFSPNSFGLYDMLGNVDELCLDQYTDNQEKYEELYSRKKYKDPFIMFAYEYTYNYRSLRGGGWNSGHKYTKITQRGGAIESYWDDLDDREAYIGFRLAIVQDIPPVKPSDSKEYIIGSLFKDKEQPRVLKSTIVPINKTDSVEFTESCSSFGDADWDFYDWYRLRFNLISSRLSKGDAFSAILYFYDKNDKVVDWCQEEFTCYSYPEIHSNTIKYGQSSSHTILSKYADNHYKKKADPLSDIQPFEFETDLLRGHFLKDIEKISIVFIIK